jgi:hypothetical protein
MNIIRSFVHSNYSQVIGSVHQQREVPKKFPFCKLVVINL